MSQPPKGPNGISIGSPVFAGFMNVTNNETDTQIHRPTTGVFDILVLYKLDYNNNNNYYYYYSVCSNSPHLNAMHAMNVHFHPKCQMKKDVNGAELPPRE